jgi:hypothetical protein
MTEHGHQKMPKFEWCVSCLANEEAILTRLIYRNNNQHGKTVLFSHIKPMEKMMRYVSSSRLEEVNRKSEESLRLLNVSSAKVSQQVLTQGIAHTRLLRVTIEVLCTITSKALSACSELRLLLNRKVFAPLFSTLYALLSRIFRCTSALITLYHSRWSSILSQIRVRPFCFIPLSQVDCDANSL